MIGMFINVYNTHALCKKKEGRARARLQSVNRTHTYVRIRSEDEE